MQAFKEYFEQDLQKKRVNALKKKPTRFRKRKIDALRTPGSTYYDPGYINGTLALDTAYSSRSTFVPQG